MLPCNSFEKALSPGFSNFKIAITLEPKVVDPYNLGDSWSGDLETYHLASRRHFGGGLLGCIGERAIIFLMHSIMTPKALCLHSVKMFMNRSHGVLNRFRMNIVISQLYQLIEDDKELDEP